MLRQGRRRGDVLRRSMRFGSFAGHSIGGSGQPRQQGRRKDGQRRGKNLAPEDELWHELVLSGVGGRTVAEAKERLSFVEFMSWQRYIRSPGTLNIGLREIGRASSSDIHSIWQA